jgi:hypothetical protein
METVVDDAACALFYKSAQLFRYESSLGAFATTSEIHEGTRQLQHKRGVGRRFHVRNDQVYEAGGTLRPVRIPYPTLNTQEKRLFTLEGRSIAEVGVAGTREVVDVIGGVRSRATEFDCEERAILEPGRV